MNAVRIISAMVLVSILSGCASMNGVSGPKGPRLIGSGHVTEAGNYAEIGIEFSSPGDFFALVAPSRWKSPVATGGSLSWINPAAWSDDPGRTGRILIGEAVVVGGAVMAASSGGGSSGSTDGGLSPTPPVLDRVPPGERPIF